jgi:hypothetical protein
MAPYFIYSHSAADEEMLTSPISCSAGRAVTAQGQFADASAALAGCLSSWDWRILTSQYQPHPHR